MSVKAFRKTNFLKSSACTLRFKENMPHFKKYRKEGDYVMMHPVYDQKVIENVKPVHYDPKGFSEKLAYYMMKSARKSFDFFTRYGKDMNEKKWLQRMVFLETVAGIPGMVAGMTRHLKSLRKMEHDHGWIHTLIEEAENERMHLMTFLTIRKPGFFFRCTVLVAQGIFWNYYFLMYLLSPSTAHKFVGYLEEEAVHTYTTAIADLDAGKLPEWESMKAPKIAIDYWKLDKDAMWRDVLLAIRADEAIHRDVNHELAAMRPDEQNTVY